MQGADVSVHQGNIDHAQYNLDFLIAKASEGVGYTDPQFVNNMQARCPIGTYHFARPDLGNAGAAEARWYWSLIQGRRHELPPCLDLEVGIGDLTSWILDFLTTLEGLSGRTPMIYSYSSFLSGHTNGAPALAHFPLWGAAYPGPFQVPAPWTSIVMHQYTSSGSAAGISGPIDVNNLLDSSILGEKPMTPDEIYNAIAPLLQQRIVAPQADTDAAIKAAQAQDRAAVASTFDALKVVQAAQAADIANLKKAPASTSHSHDINATTTPAKA